jgi:hypothetical protein
MNEIHNFLSEFVFLFKRPSTTDSENERSKLPPVNSIEDNQTSDRTKQAPIPPLQTTDDDIPSFRPQSPTAEQIASHYQTPKTNIKKKNNIDQYVEVIVQNHSIKFHLLMINPLIQHQEIIPKLNNKKNDELNQKRKM